ncbi:MAG: sugar phosphate isomerase/epimerase family protein [Candidatus Bathyarchaeia archaeon]|jgi:sugar phosphate isomerase/epimerase
MSKIYVQPLIHETFSDFVDFAEENKFNLEIATFAYANVYDADWNKILREHQERLLAFKGKLSFHGVFQDVLVNSSDKKIAEISKERIFDSLEVARKLNVTQVVFHGNFNPLVKDNYFRKNWVERNAVFWREALEKYAGTILLENTWEPTYEMFKELLDEVSSPRLMVCLDIGHLNVYSKVPFREWVENLGEKISYVHISDNLGEKDQHLEVGQGKIDWREFTAVVEECQISPEIVLEQVTLEKTKQSLSYLEKNQIYPFN